jgi:hypothetical protein
MKRHFAAKTRLSLLSILSSLAIGAFLLIPVIGEEACPSAHSPTPPVAAPPSTAPPASATNARLEVCEDAAATPEIELLLTQLRGEQGLPSPVALESRQLENLSRCRDEADRAQNNARLNPSHAPLPAAQRETVANGLARFDGKREELETELSQLRREAFAAAVRSSQYRVVRRLRPEDDPRLVESNPKVVIDQLARQLGAEGRDWVLKRLHGHQQVALVYTTRRQAPELFRRMDSIRSLEEQRRQWLESYMVSRTTPLPRGI